MGGTSNKGMKPASGTGRLALLSSVELLGRRFYGCEALASIDEPFNELESVRRWWEQDLALARLIFPSLFLCAEVDWAEDYLGLSR